MRGHCRILINTPEIELWPGGLLQARSNHDARILARARVILRRKQDGRYLAADLPEGLMPLAHRLKHEPGLDAALDALGDLRERRRPGLDVVDLLPLHRLQDRLESLDMDADAYGARTGLELIPEPRWLAFAGFDRYRRPLWLHVAAARAWRHMREAALREEIVLDAISGYRSHDYQLGIFERKLTRGQTIDAILTVNAAPGYSEHHGGCALDIGAPGEAPAEESFEATSAFAWLTANAASFGFVMSYRRDNPHGIVYEPWHWMFSAMTPSSSAP